MRNRIVGIAAAFALISSQIVASAQADTFTPTNDPPTVENLIVPGAMQPASPRSTANYEVVATVGSQGTVANLKTVTMCWYKGSSDDTCADAATDPKTQFKMTWTQASNSFSVTGTNNYLNAGSSTTYGDGSGLTMDVTFKFKISEAMLFGEDWNVKVVVIDQQDNSTSNDPIFSSELSASNLVVLYFGSVKTQPSSKSFGSLKLSESSQVTNVSSGAFTANGLSDIDISATDFTYNSETIPLDAMNMTPASGYVAMDCNAGSSFGDNYNVRVSSIAQIFIDDQFSDGTGEGTESALPHSCQLTYGGGAPVANVVYSNTVTVGIGQSY